VCPQAAARLAIAKSHAQVPAKEVQNNLCESIIFTEGHTLYHTRYHTTHIDDDISLRNQHVKHFNNGSYMVSDHGSDPASDPQCDTKYQTSYHTGYQFITPSIRPHITPRPYHTEGQRLYHTAYQTTYHTKQLIIAPIAHQLP
jgi:hypothetical protein